MIITVATGPYAHTASLNEASDCALQIEHESIEPGEIFGRMLRDACWDVAEMSLASMYMLIDRDDRRFVPLPVFLSRTFRHSALYLPLKSKVRHPRELEGGTFGVLRYSMTGAIYVRALLAEQYGMQIETVKWVVGDESVSPPRVQMRRVDGLRALDEMAAAGTLDCLISGKAPPSFLTGKLRRLFPDFGAEERSAFEGSAIFPIMHGMVARRALTEEQPDVVRLLLERFEQAKARADASLRNLDFPAYPLPWLGAYVADAVRRMGPELWPYGVQANRRTLDHFGQLIAKDGLTSRPFTADDVFSFR